MSAAALLPGPWGAEPPLHAVLFPAKRAVEQLCGITLMGRGWVCLWLGGQTWVQSEGGGTWGQPLCRGHPCGSPWEGGGSHTMVPTSETHHEAAPCSQSRGSRTHHWADLGGLLCWGVSWVAVVCV